MKLLLLLLSLFGVTLVSGIFIGGGGGGGSSSSSSEEHYSGGGGGHHHHPRPPGPRPPRPPPPAPRPPPRPPCPSQWLTFDRRGYRWCVLVVHANVNYYNAQQRCAALGGTLSGIQTNEERLALAAEGRRIQRAFSIGEGSIWLGARRKSSCPRRASCDPLSTFSWVDGVTTGTAGITFGTYQPDGYLIGNLAQDCLQQFIYPSVETSRSYPNIPHGTLDDQFCTWTTNPRNRFFACGKRA